MGVRHVDEALDVDGQVDDPTTTTALRAQRGLVGALPVNQS
jgi:hypothetical protein